MSRKPTDFVQTGLRIRELLRRKLEKEAEKHRVSINKEMTMRVEDSFEKAAAMSLEESASFLRNQVERLEARELAARRMGDLLRAFEELLRQIDGHPALKTHAGLKAASTKGKAVIEAIDNDDKKARRLPSTTGEDVR